MIKQFAAKIGIEHQLKCIHFGRQIKSGRFTSNEPEYRRLSEWVRPGDWALDVGANVGHYTVRLSELVGPTGRVIAFEPVPETFAILAANCRLLPCQNVTLINAAASEKMAVASMSIPAVSGIKNFYQARLGAGTLSILSIPIDSLGLPRIAFVKIDVEGHEKHVLSGMSQTIERDHPVLVLEDADPIGVVRFLEQRCYRFTDDTKSPNRVYLPVLSKSNVGENDRL